ncbi:MAG: ABC transporter permease [Thermoplasmatota archaeon]
MAALRFAQKAFTIAEFEARKMRRDPTELFTRAIQPAMWLLVFGPVMAKIRHDPLYVGFLAPGILAQSVLFVAIFYGIAVIWERDLGILQKFLATPTPRSAIVLGKGLSAGVRSMSQVVLVYILSFLLGVHLDVNPVAVLLVLVAVFLGATLFATVSILLASLVKTRERFLGIGQVLTMPLFFASNAIYDINDMPGWLRAVATVNPLTYEVDALRSLMLAGPVPWWPVARDFAVLVLVTAALVWLGGRTYARTVAQ